MRMFFLMHPELLCKVFLTMEFCDKIEKKIKLIERSIDESLS